MRIFASLTPREYASYVFKALATDASRSDASNLPIFSEHDAHAHLQSALDDLATSAAKPPGPTPPPQRAPPPNAATNKPSYELAPPASPSGSPAQPRKHGRPATPRTSRACAQARPCAAQAGPPSVVGSAVPPDPRLKLALENKNPASLDGHTTCNSRPSQRRSPRSASTQS